MKDYKHIQNQYMTEKLYYPIHYFVADICCFFITIFGTMVFLIEMMTPYYFLVTTIFITTIPTTIFMIYDYRKFIKNRSTKYFSQRLKKKPIIPGGILPYILKNKLN